VPLYFPAQGDSSKCQESCSMWLLESHHWGTCVLGKSARDLGLGMCVGHLGCWAQRVGHEFDPVILVRPMENNSNNKFCHILIVS